jgi:hypothetical protein
VDLQCVSAFRRECSSILIKFASGVLVSVIFRVSISRLDFSSRFFAPYIEPERLRALGGSCGLGELALLAVPRTQNARLALAELQLETQGTRRASKTHSLGRSVLFCLAYGCQFQ